MDSHIIRARLSVAAHKSELAAEALRLIDFQTLEIAKLKRDLEVATTVARSVFEVLE